MHGLSRRPPLPVHNPEEGTSAQLTFKYPSSRFSPATQSNITTRFLNKMDVTIIGSGVIGLLFALVLNEARYKVTIIARDLPGDENQNWASPWYFPDPPLYIFHCVYLMSNHYVRPEPVPAFSRTLNPNIVCSKPSPSNTIGLSRTEIPQVAYKSSKQQSTSTTATMIQAYGTRPSFLNTVC
ncbi:hypothetical protein BDV19DRAFT_357049 [Aspergillus venezuelensis]